MVKDAVRDHPRTNAAVDTSEAFNRRIHLAFVEDDDDYREAVSNELSDHGFTVDRFSDGSGLLDFFAGGGEADIILLDWNLPSVSGIDLLPRLRRAGIALPVLLLTGLSHPANEELALDRGALDFVDKTRGVPIVAQRLRLIASKNSAERELHFDRLVLKPGLSRAYWDDTDLDLTVSEFKIVHLLASNTGNYVTYPAVHECMPYAGVVTGRGENGYRTSIRACIKRIRNKFRSVDPAFAEIDVYQSFGYRWGKATADRVKKGTMSRQEFQMPCASVPDSG